MGNGARCDVCGGPIGASPPRRWPGSNLDRYNRDYCNKLWTSDRFPRRCADVRDEEATRAIKRFGTCISASVIPDCWIWHGLWCTGVRSGLIDASRSSRGASQQPLLTLLCVKSGSDKCPPWKRTAWLCPNSDMSSTTSQILMWAHFCYDKGDGSTHCLLKTRHQ